MAYNPFEALDSVVTDLAADANGIGALRPIAPAPVGLHTTVPVAAAPLQVDNAAAAQLAAVSNGAVPDSRDSVSVHAVGHVLSGKSNVDIVRLAAPPASAAGPSAPLAAGPRMTITLRDVRDEPGGKSRAASNSMGGWGEQFASRAPPTAVAALPSSGVPTTRALPATSAYGAPRGGDSGSYRASGDIGSYRTSDPRRENRVVDRERETYGRDRDSSGGYDSRRDSDSRRESDNRRGSDSRLDGANWRESDSRRDNGRDSRWEGRRDGGGSYERRGTNERDDRDRYTDRGDTSRGYRNSPIVTSGRGLDAKDTKESTHAHTRSEVPVEGGSGRDVTWPLAETHTERQFAGTARTSVIAGTQSTVSAPVVALHSALPPLPVGAAGSGSGSGSGPATIGFLGLSMPSHMHWHQGEVTHTESSIVAEANNSITHDAIVPTFLDMASLLGPILAPIGISLPVLGIHAPQAQLTRERGASTATSRHTLHHAASATASTSGGKAVGGATRQASGKPAQQHVHDGADNGATALSGTKRKSSSTRTAASSAGKHLDSRIKRPKHSRSHSASASTKASASTTTGTSGSGSGVASSARAAFISKVKAALKHEMYQFYRPLVVAGSVSPAPAVADAGLLADKAEFKEVAQRIYVKLLPKALVEGGADHKYSRSKVGAIIREFVTKYLQQRARAKGGRNDEAIPAVASQAPSSTSGMTLSSGTGSTAAATNAPSTSLVGAGVDVELPRESAGGGVAEMDAGSPSTDVDGDDGEAIIDEHEPGLEAAVDVDSDNDSDNDNSGEQLIPPEAADLFE